MPRFIVAFVILAGTLASPAQAQHVAGVFSQGRTHLYVTGGTGSSFGETYTVLGAGVEYFVIDGLSAGLAFESWSGANPGFTTITPSVRYVFYGVPTVKPYVGAFYRRTDIDDLPSLDSVGVRAGVYVQAGRNAYVGFGVSYESYRDCEPTVYRKCDNTYPELSFGVVF
ncbi:MAG: hypothetical protein ACREVQ_14055 [Burkholderiales bacterium]